MTLAMPLGILIAVAGATLLFTTDHQKAGKIVLGIGIAITVITFLLFIFMVSSNM